jgi:hypothetical protein
MPQVMILPVLKQVEKPEKALPIQGTRQGWKGAYKRRAGMLVDSSVHGNDVCIHSKNFYGNSYYRLIIRFIPSRGYYKIEILSCTDLPPCMVGPGSKGQADPPTV